MAASLSNGLVSCGHCLEVEGYLLDPKTLPCHHIFCLTCLDEHFGGKKLIKCFTCKREYHQTFDSLPSAMDGMNCYCDTCASKGKNSMTAKVFCTECKRKYCAKHEEVHDDLNPGHKTIGIVAYRDSAFADEIRYCDKHTSEPSTMGCKVCWKILCPMCVTTDKKCEQGKPHDLMALIDLEKEFTGYMEPMKQEVEDRFDELAAIVKDVTHKLSEWDTETERSVTELNDARNNQVKELDAKYGRLEADYRESRGSGKENLTQYKEDIGTKLSQLQNILGDVRSDISRKHVIDAVKGRNLLVKQLRLFMSEGFPELVLKDQTTLTRTGSQFRDLEMKMKSADDLIIRPSPTPFTQTFKLFSNLINQPPSSIELIKEVTVGGNPTSVYHYKGFTYVGHVWGSVHRVDRAGNVVNNFIKPGNRFISGLAAHQDRLYILMFNNDASGHCVIVYDLLLEGKRCHSWNIDDRETGFYRVFAVSGDSVILANRPKKEILIYTLTGVFIRTVKCEQLSLFGVYLTQLGRNSILVTNDSSQPKFFKVNLENGTVEWQSEGGTIANPRGITAYCQDYSLVTTERTNRTQLWILNHVTGEIMKELRDPAQRPCWSSVFDMAVDGDTVIISRYNENKILYYRLIFE